MLDFAEAIEARKVLIAEAGVGIGKSFAYLIPGLIYSNKTKLPLIVSSSSIQLTEQLTSDIESVSEILSSKFTYVVGKGRTNYLCYTKYISKNNKDVFDQITIQEQWDSEQIDSQSKKMWCVEQCTFNRCEYRHDCNFYNMRYSLKSRISVNCSIVNHNLLVEDLKKKNYLYQQGLIQNGHTIVLDEAHKFEEVVRDSFNIKITLNSIKAMQSKIKELGFDISRNLKTTEKLYELINNFNRELMEKNKHESKYIIGNRLDIKDLLDKKSKDIDTLLWEINDMKNELRYLDYKESKESVYNGLEEFINILIEYFNSISLETSVYWASFEKTFNSHGFCLYSAPKEIDEIINKLLFENQTSVVLTSATLGGNNENNVIDNNESYYEYQKVALGLPQKTIYSKQQKSPYDFENNTILYLPSIDVRDDLEINSIVDEIIRLANLIGGRTLVLFTSKKQMESVYAGMLAKKDEYSWKLIKQDDNKAPNIVREEFVSQKAVLLSAGTFWEGINIKGPELSCLIIVKLPYPAQDPVIQYKASKNSNVFESEMMIKLKQGTGRLIRSEYDLGVIAILDKRVKEKKYILNALPFSNITESMDEVKKFIDERMTQYLHNS